MVAALEIVLAVGLLLVGASFGGVILGRINDRTLRALVLALGGLASFAAAVLGIGLATDRWEWRPLAVVLGGLLAATAAEAGALGLARGLARIRSVEAEGARVLERVEASLAAHTQLRLTELERTLARERSETSHLIAEQERGLREAGRAGVEQQVETARRELTDAVVATQQRLEQRLTAWSGDLERAQGQLKARLEELIRRQAGALQDHEARLAGHAAEVAALEDEQRAAIARIRADLARSLEESFEAAKAEIEVHAAERRRALHEVGERLRVRERTLREQVEREEGEVRTQLAAAVADVERRAVEQLERALERSVVRLSEDADRRFDAQLKESRERAADRLGRELELSMEHFSRSAEKEVATRIAEAAQAAAAKLQRQIDDVVGAAEAQTGISNERIRALTQRLDRSLEVAHERLAAFEAHVELELSAKLAEIERALRAAEHQVERERAV